MVRNDYLSQSFDKLIGLLRQLHGLFAKARLFVLQVAFLAANAFELLAKLCMPR